MGSDSKKSSLFIVVFVAVILLFNQSYVRAELLEDTLNGYSFEYPFGWQSRAFPDSENLIKGEINKDNNTGIQIRIYQNAGNFRKFVDWYVDDFMQQMQKHWGGKMAISEEEFTSVAGYECFVVSFDFIRRDNKRWFFKQYLWPNGSEVLILQSGTLFKLRALNEPSIDAIAESLKFLK